jgi:hypothetical protein
VHNTFMLAVTGRQLERINRGPDIAIPNMRFASFTKMLVNSNFIFILPFVCEDFQCNMMVPSVPLVPPSVTNKFMKSLTANPVQATP